MQRTATGGRRSKPKCPLLALLALLLAACGSHRTTLPLDPAEWAEIDALAARHAERPVHLSSGGGAESHLAFVGAALRSARMRLHDSGDREPAGIELEVAGPSIEQDT